jgi:gliding motility-associated protein GldE
MLNLLQIPFVETSEYALWAFVGVLLGLVGLLFFFVIVSGAEISYFSLSHENISSFKDSPHRKERQIAYLLSKPRNLQIMFIIVLRLIKVTFITLAVFTVEHFFAETIEEWFLLVIFFSTLLLIFGELIPRVYAHERQLRFTKRHAYEVSISYYTFYPFAKIFSIISEWLEKRVTPKEYDVAIDTLPEVLDEIQLEGDTVEKDKQLLREIVKLTTTKVKQVMVPRQKMFMLKASAPFSEILQKVRDMGFSRVPVYEENLDDIVGIIYLKDLLIHQHQTDTFEWTTLLRKIMTVSETETLITVFRKFKTKRVHIAIVTDELGVVLGLVTMEDLVEEVLGEIKDEFDEHEILNYSKLTQHTFVFEGKESIENMCQILQISEETFDEVRMGSQTLNGLLTVLWRKIPRVGEDKTFANLKFTIAAATSRMIQKVEVEVLKEL